MFRRYPYWGWLVLSILLLGINGYQFSQHRNALLPERMAHTVTKDMQRRDDAFHQFAENQDLVHHMFAGGLTARESEDINNQPFYVFAYSNDTLKSWNTNVILPETNDSLLGKTEILRSNSGVFIARYLRPFVKEPHHQLVILYPVLLNYPIENSYLRSHFISSTYIPINTQILEPEEKSTGAFPVTLKDNTTLFSLRFNPGEIQKWVPDTLFIVMLILALITSMSWIQLMILYMTRNKSRLAGFIVTLGLIAIFRTLLYLYGLPFNLDTLNFFSPSLYASSNILSSFGDLVIDTLCFLWLAVFLIRHTSYKKYHERIRGRHFRTFTAFVLFAVLICFLYLFVSVIRSLILDSNISFDVGHYYTINVYTVLGLMEIGTITGLACLVIYLINTQLQSLIEHKETRYLLVAFTGAFFIIITAGFRDLFNWSVLAWLLLFLYFMDKQKLTIVSDLFEPQMIFWALFICAFGTGMLQYFNEIKEAKARMAYVELRLSPHRDNMMEFTFDKVARNIALDKQLKSFLYNPTQSGRKYVGQRLDAQYLTGPLNKYNVKVYLYDADTRPLFNKDSVNYQYFERARSDASMTKSSNLFYKETSAQELNYISYIPIYSDTINKKIGYVIVNMEPKKQVAENVSNELLQPTTDQAINEETEYAYAVYTNGKLVTQTNVYPFTTYLTEDTLKEGQSAYYETDGVSELHYKISNNRTIVVVHYHSMWLETMSLFSYLFVTLVLLGVFILLYQLYISYFTGTMSSARFMVLTLRRRVHFSMLAIVIFSFVIIGATTVGFFTYQYRTSNNKKLQSAMKLVKHSVQDYLTRADAYATDELFDTVSRSPRFKDYITAISLGQKIDVNIFAKDGELLSGSQEDIYNKEIIARRMRPEAYYTLNNAGKSIFINNERIGRLSYLSAYEPLRDDRGLTLGYINTPFFSSEKDLDLQLSNIVITLINIYAFIFLVSSLLTVGITRWITRSFDIIRRQFSQVTLQANERISWAYDDEIGALVKEYNKMIDKVEENAALLAQSERESAWREMARQVAHEIKNPLTPMKLNIQYLQQAMRNDSPNVKELTDKVSQSIIEQIDNLSYIASEFSNFAKMPEARAEELEMYDMLHKALELYMNDGHIQVNILRAERNLFVQSDRSQLLRVFTNLLENAKQAIPGERQGTINVSLTTEEGFALVMIQDNGTGIPEDVARRIFQPYFTTKSSGTGLGLAMTKKIIEFWRGSIWFESVESGGTTFFIKLPLIKSS